jgi:hypothetical protein
MHFSIKKSRSMPSRDLHFNRPPATVVQHEQSIPDRASAGGEINLLHQTAEVDVLDRVVVVEVDVLA